MSTHLLQGSFEDASDEEAGVAGVDAAPTRLRRRQSRTPAESPSSKRGFEIEVPDEDAALSTE